MSDWIIVDEKHKCPDTPGYYEVREYNPDFGAFTTSLVYADVYPMRDENGVWCPNGKAVVAYRYVSDEAPYDYAEMELRVKDSKAYYSDPVTGACLTGKEHTPRTFRVTLAVDDITEEDELQLAINDLVQTLSEDVLGFVFVDIKEVTNE